MFFYAGTTEQSVQAFQEEFRIIGEFDSFFNIT